MVELKTNVDQLPLTPEAVAQICRCPVENVRLHLLCIVKALKEQEIYTPRTLIAALATIATEVPKFCPLREIGGSAYFTKMYENRRDLGNTHPGDGARYCGRGFIQLTGRANYQIYGNRLGLNLENNPALALLPEVSAQILALYFKDRGINKAADLGNWRHVRKRVNGGYNGWNRFKALVQAFSAHLG